MVSEPVFRNGVWWQQQTDGTWLRWNEGAQTWERTEIAPPPDGAGLPPPPTPGQGVGNLYPRGPMLPPASVPSHLVWAILVTLFCFLPTGIVAIVYASQVGSKLAAGDVLGAREASNKAKMWSIISAVAGFVVGILVVASSVGTSTTTTFT